VPAQPSNQVSGPATQHAGRPAVPSAPPVPPAGAGPARHPDRVALPVRPPLAHTGLRRRFTAWLRRTPGILALLMAGLVGLGLAMGATGIGAVQQRAELVGGVAAGNGPLVVAAQDLYRALSDADATVAEAFLMGGSEPAGLRTRYREDLAAASDALVRLAGGVSAEAAEEPIRRISANLPVYTGIVETARSLNRQGLPLGAAYLREASALMRDALLPAAQELYRAVSAQLADARDEASAVPWLALPLGLLTLAALIAAQIFLVRRTNRVFNLGLVAATAAALVAVLWLGVAWVGASGSLTASRQDGSAQVDLFAEARIAALQARGDESLTLVARGAGAEFEKRFAETMTRLAGDDGTGGLLGQAKARATDAAGRAAAEAAMSDVKKWRELHTRIRELDDSGRYPEAVQLAVGTDDGSAGGVFTKLDLDLAQGLRHGGDRFDREVAGAADAFGGVAGGLGVLTTVLLFGVVVGMAPRVMEYR
jgi:hypothetical protein